MKVSLDLEITEHSLAIAELNLPVEPGLADGGKVKVLFSALPQECYEYHQRQGPTKGLCLHLVASLPVSHLSLLIGASMPPWLP